MEVRASGLMSLLVMVRVWDAAALTQTFYRNFSGAALPDDLVWKTLRLNSDITCALEAHRLGASFFGSRTSVSTDTIAECFLPAPGTSHPDTFPTREEEGFNHLVWVALEDVASEDVALEDVASEDVASEDASSTAPAGDCYTTQTAPCTAADEGTYYLHPTDCAKYLRCSVGTVYEMDCAGGGLHFMKSISNCNFAASVTESCFCETPP